MAHVKEFDRIREAYLAMAETACYRPAAPRDGMGSVTLSEDELNDPAQIEEEATAYATEFIEEEEELKFSIGISNFRTNRALVYIIEAARLLCSVQDKRATKLLEMALEEINRP